jgi:hypothetical protein
VLPLTRTLFGSKNGYVLMEPVDNLKPPESNDGSNPLLVPPTPDNRLNPPPHIVPLSSGKTTQLCRSLNTSAALTNPEVVVWTKPSLCRLFQQTQNLITKIDYLVQPLRNQILTVSLVITTYFHPL